MLQVTLTRSGTDDGVLVKTLESKVSFVLIAGQPLNEPVAAGGPVCFL